jgi:hypothetical protein
MPSTGKHRDQQANSYYRALEELGGADVEPYLGFRFWILDILDWPFALCQYPLPRASLLPGRSPMIDEQGSAEQRPNVHGSSQPHEQTLQTFKNRSALQLLYRRLAETAHR